MNHTAKLARHDALTEAIRETDAAIGDEQPTEQALRILAAIKRLRDSQPVKVESTARVDYLSKVQKEARNEWQTKREVFAAFFDDNTEAFGPEHDATAGIDTPLGRLVATVWRQRWAGKRGERITWAGSYMLDGEPITVAEIRAAGLAQRPTTRNRKKK